MRDLTMADLATAPAQILASRQKIADGFRAHLAARCIDRDVFPTRGDQEIAAWLCRYDRGALNDYFAEA